MIWPIIAFMCEVGRTDSELEEYDEHDVDEVLLRYRCVINNYCEKFEFATRIVSDYIEFHPDMKSKERTKRFVDEKWGSYKDSFDIKNATDETIEVVIRLTIANVLRNRTLITDIKRKVKL
ncbi:hypothetical protein FACS189490_13510 [Clostridia bacterium]|nr:hypothetical protein FACS189490_13510 [Clostridia bacterium]